MRAIILRPALSALVLALIATPGCSLKRIAINSVANSLAETGDTFAADPDPELIRAAVPFSLKLVESLLAEVPNHRGLLLTACSGFTQYAYGFVDSDAEMLRLEDYTRHVRVQERAQRMYLRARDYCLRSLELGSPGITKRLTQDPEKAVATLQKKDVPLLYLDRRVVGQGRRAQPRPPRIGRGLPDRAGPGPPRTGTGRVLELRGDPRRDDLARGAAGKHGR